jgi:hypothetical protein
MQAYWAQQGMWSDATLFELNQGRRATKLWPATLARSTLQVSCTGAATSKRQESCCIQHHEVVNRRRARLVCERERRAEVEVSAVPSRNLSGHVISRVNRSQRTRLYCTGKGRRLKAALFFGPIRGADASYNVALPGPRLVRGQLMELFVRNQRERPWQEQ